MNFNLQFYVTSSDNVAFRNSNYVFVLFLQLIKFEKSFKTVTKIKTQHGKPRGSRAQTKDA